MEIISHIFWAGTAYKVAKKMDNQSRLKKKINFLLFIFWSAVPDLISFGLMAFWVVLVFISSGFNSSFLPSHMRAVSGESPPAPEGFMSIFQMTSVVYSVSHSIIIFFLVFGLIFLIIKKLPWTLLGWLFHILIDIPTHSAQFYPTPFLWPISEWAFRNGVSWGAPWFLILNYSSMIFVYVFFWRKNKKSGIQPPL